MMEPIQMDQNQMDDEKTTIQLRKKYWETENVKNNVKERQVEIIQRSNSTSSEEEPIPEIKDIYDHIYGNVQSKRVFYEGRRNSDKISSSDVKNNSVIGNSKDNKLNHIDTTEIKLVTASDSSIDKNNVENSLTTEVDKLIFEQEQEPEDITIKKTPDQVDNSIILNKNVELEDALTPTPVNSPIFDKKNFERQQSSNELPQHENTCKKCQKTDFINDRSEVLTEINANLKLELESVKQQLKNEMSKNNELNFEIANIEATLEIYYKEAKNQKSTLSSIYSAMKNYVSDPKTDLQETYTYKRIKMIADYMESLKYKLEHQDKIIRNNFIENPYYTDLIIKHEAVLKQLDDMSQVNQELNEEIKKKAQEELEIIKELNRQKFQIEHKCKEMEDYYRNEIISKESLIARVEDEYKKQLEDFQTVLDQKDEEMAKIQKTATARINNYKQELVIVYRKWKEQKKFNNSDK